MFPSTCMRLHPKDSRRCCSCQTTPVVLTTRRGHFRMTSHDSMPVCRASILFVCTMGGVPMEFMGAYAPQANSENSDAANS